MIADAWKEQSGVVFDIQKCCVQDGPGVRTSVFLKGCTMRCPWCHNPESLAFAPQLGLEARKCLSCRACVAACPQGAHSISVEGVHRLDSSLCTACGTCIPVCPGGCLKRFGATMTAQQVMVEVGKDAKYYASTGGGVTFTGGEPTCQPDFLLALLTLSKAQGIHTCLETNGAISPRLLDSLLPLVDLFLLDYKATGPSHKTLTGVEEQVVLDTVTRLEVAGKPTVLRCPIIPGENDTPAHFEAIKALVNRHACITHREIMPYHASARHKWQALSLPYSLSSLPTATGEQKKAWEQASDPT